MIRLLGALALVLTLAACSSEPDVDWQRYETGVRVKIDIDNLAAAGDCDSLANRMENAEDGDLWRYVEHKAEEAGCF